MIIDSNVIASIIYDPIRDEMFFAEKGKGAYLNNSRIRVSSNNKRSRAIFVLESTDLISFFNIQDEVVENFRVLGSSSLDLANTANGKIDCYFSWVRHTWSWDRYNIPMAYRWLWVQSLTKVGGWKKRL